MKIHFKTAWNLIRRSPFQAISALFVLTLTFFVATIISVLVYSSSKLIEYFETRPQVIAFITQNATDTDISDLQHKLSVNTHIQNIKYVSKEEALSIYKKATSNNPLLGQLVSPSIFPASLEFSVTDLNFAQEIIDLTKQEKIVDSIGFTAALGGESSLKDVVARLKTITSYVRIGGIILVGLLTATSLVVLFVIISMRMIGRREEIEILNLIGATRSFIKTPIMIEATIYTIIGVIFGWAVAFTTILYSTPALVTYFGDIPILPKNALEIFELFGLIFVGEFICALILAFFSSSLAVSRAKKVR